MDEVRKIVDWNVLGPNRTLEHSEDGVFVVDRTGAIRWANTSVRRLFGYSRPELVGQSIETVIPDSLGDKHGDYLAAWFRHPEDRSMGKDLSIQGRHKDGDLMDVMIKLTVLETDHEILACAWVRERTKG